MASTRKSSRVRVPKIREDAATPSKRNKANTAPATTPATTAAPNPAPAAAATTPVSAPFLGQPQTLVVIPSPAVTDSTLNVISVPIMFEAGANAGAVASNGEETETNTAAPSDGAAEEVEKVATAIFKDPSFVHSSIGAAGSKRTRVWKNLKQIISTERSLPWQSTDVTYGSIEGPPSFKPAKRYSDLSGLEAPYTDPQTKLRFATPDEFTRARTLPSDLVSGYLALRKASAPVP